MKYNLKKLQLLLAITIILLLDKITISFSCRQSFVGLKIHERELISMTFVSRDGRENKKKRKINIGISESNKDATLFD